jgi:hypothetical protein
MEDPKLITDLATLGATAWASKELAGKLLGPTFEYLGGEIGNFAKKCNVNLTDVFLRARRILNSRVDEAGGVNPRVVKDVIDQAAFCDDAMAAEYVAGVLASSRTENSQDDRGVAYLAVIRQLSTFQLRMHYLVYHSIKVLLNGKDLSALNFQGPPHMRIFLPMTFLRENDLFTASEDEHVLLTHVFNGLARHDLIGSAWWGGEEGIVRAGEPHFKAQPGYFVNPTGFGVELFLWAHGFASMDVSGFLSPELMLQPLPDFPVLGLPLHIPDLSSERAQAELAHKQQTDAFVRRIIAERQGL